MLRPNMPRLPFIIVALWLGALPMAVPAGTEETRFTVKNLNYSPPSKPESGDVTVTFMGITTVLITDGDTNLLSDGYFSRVAPASLEEKLTPDNTAIRAALSDLGIQQAAAVMVVHSHYDHALDAPVVAALTGATLLGSESTSNIGRGHALPEAQIRTVIPGRAMTFGKFEVTFVESRHWPLPEPYASLILNQTIDAPLKQPAGLVDYKEGSTYSIIVEHPQGTILLQGSAGYVPGALANFDADVALLGTGGLADLPVESQNAYYAEMIEVTGVRQIFPVHWDVMSTPLNQPLQPASDFQASMAFLKAKQGETGVPFALLRKGEPVAVFRNSPGLEEKD